MYCADGAKLLQKSKCDKVPDRFAQDLSGAFEIVLAAGALGP